MPMLLLLIPIVWLGLIAFVVVLCQMAARSDALIAAATPPERDERSGPIGPRRFRRRAVTAPSRRRFARTCG